MLNIRSALVAIFLGVAVAACGSTQGKQSAGEYIDDASITTKVKTAFVADKQVSALDVKVDTFKGVVQLSGFADNRAEIDRAAEIARNVKGVKSVRNDIRLKTSQ